VVQDRYRYFRVEAREILDQLGQGALDLEKGGAKGASPTDSVARLLRLAHTLKGAAHVVKQREIADRAHALEDALSPFSGSSAPASRDVVDRVFSLVDEIGRYVAQLTPQASAAAVWHPASADSSDLPLLAFRPAMDDLDALLGSVLEAHVRLGALRPRAAQVERARHLATLAVDQLSRPRDAEAVRTGREIQTEKARAMVETLQGTLGALERDLTSSIDQLDRELQQVREAAERLRLAPASALFMFLERAARDVAKALGKRVTFAASGGEVRVDPVVLNMVQGALLHVVRNAVAHGIEGGVAERAAAGKPVDGHVTLRIVQRGTVVSFACTDDGRGVDLDAVQRIAQQKGLGVEGGGAMEREELLRLLLKGGISTSGTVTEVSGRGIGLDVVREAAERLGGTATVQTEAGKGTTIEIVVPLSIASLHALVVEASGTAMAIPLHAVRGGLRLVGEDVLRTAQRESILFDARRIPLASMPRAVAATRASAPSPRNASAHASAVVVHGRTGMAAFTVDRVMGARHVIMRSLPVLAPASGVVAGVALDAVGDPLLVLDPDSLVAGAERPGAVSLETLTAPVSVLVVDDSLTTRMLEQSILESAGYTVDLATSGEEGLIKARAGHHALFLVDVEMPGMDGFTFVERTRADPALRHIPAILVTSRSAPEDLQRGHDAGAQAYIVKGEFDQRVLLERIRMLLE
jgi:two-component system chemotaxis sensor kinase CheA